MCSTSTIFLILGDGDFTFSLDFARFLFRSSSSSLTHNNNNNNNNTQVEAAVVSAATGTEKSSAITNHREENHDQQQDTSTHFHLIATGYDSFHELTGKYRDAPFVLKRLKDISSSSSQHDNGYHNRRPLVQVSIHHGVNAIRTTAARKSENAVDDKDANNSSDGFVVEKRADYVIFNHPHLGTEDAQLHSRFLCHLFHSVRTVWLKRQGYFHLTLADGQFERWGCAQAAEQNGMVLVDRSVFHPPPVVPATTTRQQRPGGGSPASAEEEEQQQQQVYKKRCSNANYYTLRRHQTGRSFRSRATGPSETFTFARKHGVNQGGKAAVPIWIDGSSSSASPQGAFPCPFCERIFREERSVKAHVQSKHPHGNKAGEDEIDAYLCPYCSSDHGENGQPRRTFGSRQALEDHMRAKHTAQHTNIQPDWCTQQPTPPPPAYSRDDDTEVGYEVGSSSGDRHRQGMCDICSLEIFNKTEHLKSFEPGGISDYMGTTESTRSQPCQYCNKRFREKRAKLQHENTCTSST